MVWCNLCNFGAWPEKVSSSPILWLTFVTFRGNGGVNHIQLDLWIVYMVHNFKLYELKFSIKRTILNSTKPFPPKAQGVFQSQCPCSMHPWFMYVWYDWNPITRKLTEKLKSLMDIDGFYCEQCVYSVCIFSVFLSVCCSLIFNQRTSAEQLVRAFTFNPHAFIDKSSDFN